MDKKIKSLVLNRNHYTVMGNDLIKGKQDMTVQEARLLRILITQVVKEDKDLKTYRTTVPELAGFLGIPKQDIYRDIRNIIKSLISRTVHIGTGNPKDPWAIFPWIQLASYDGEGSITLMLSEAIKPYVLELQKYFTQYQLSNVLELNSFYAIRLYEILKCDDYRNEDYQTYDVSYLRECMGCENKYPVFKDFRRRVIEIAIREINAKTDIEIRDVQYKRRGRKIAEIGFYVGINRRPLL